ncbi:flagellar export protein FliJ [Cytobacillus praedii]|uniref:Flagellar FliJ protein n=1 Tax=Cytobacillus praedii TaxID=1742358 RepID=A0A4R1AZA1_9BACI|nr:flagellar export protein FliJ [Cytobacillus praedii]MED3552190.1 flagellar export protein FliJ [Cytobacillus praedii]MED3573415.1 flagellar export protein FliJ [Cytobacillus praedii]TCJ05987.1 flagellar biosynthesis chaperone FliJ [Cytobacillus praedii]
MQYQYKFAKILSIKEREKDEAFNVYNQAVKKFEEAAEKLYGLLKKKEDLESFQSERLVNGIHVQEMRHHQHFIYNLEKTINHYQQIVINARNHMNFYQEKLMEKNMEVKKYEKIKEKDFTNFTENIKQLEGKQMDDISIQQYMSRGS